MSNPAPTLNQINAFNATRGTTIDFNIIGGTELVRSNRIYIYDLSDNSLICTHLYVSTESIHELPANTDSSIVYESGKSSADFVNGAQYYAQIQTYTDTAGTQGGSGLSVAKMFWCLVDPTLIITTIPSTISTTSYNVSATYTDTSASVVSNIIQQYQFNLYSATGSLLQSSGVVVGSGTQQGTSDVYDISYNFTGLNVGSSYYVTVEVTTTQGMSVNAQSGTFTVSIDTPTLGEATVVNNACDGYISVTSNLSGEYGGSASGEIASFVTDSVNNISSLKVDIDPVQDLHGYDKPWVGGAGKNLWNNNWADYTQPNDYRICPITLEQGAKYTLKSELVGTAVTGCVVGIVKDGDRYSNFVQPSPWSFLNTSGTPVTTAVTFTIDATWTNPKLIIYCSNETAFNSVFANYHFWLEKGESVSAWTPYSNICPITGWTGCEVVVSPTEDAQDGTTYPVSWQTEAGTVYGGTVDVVTGVLTVDRASVTLNGSAGSLSFSEVSQATTADGTKYVAYINSHNVAEEDAKAMSSQYEWIDKPLNYLHTGELNTRGGFMRFVIHDQSLDTIAKWNAYLANNPMQLVYELAIPTTYQLTPTQIQTLVGANNVWADCGDVEVTYNIPITNLLVKRQDVADVSGAWLTLYSQPITQASDMNFTFIDFTNQYGKTYKYALVPLLTQTQSGVEVEVEGGYTVSDEVQSIFDGVFIADSTGSQKCKANVGYGNVDMNQVVGSITPIGAKYPIIITNSQNQYHNGSISGTIVPDDYYFNGNLSRIDMVNKRSELEQFLTNKRAKIIKDWNGNIWLVMIMDNVSCTFNNNYGMGIVNFSTSWVEVGDPTNQEDLQATGLINIGGV